MRLWTLKQTRVPTRYKSKAEEKFHGYFSSKEAALEALRKMIPEIDSWEFSEYPELHQKVFIKEHSYYEINFVIQGKHQLDILLNEREHL